MDTTTVSSDDLSPEEREAFQQAFLSPHGVVSYLGRPYTVSAMDQAYADGDEDSIRVTFTLKPAAAPRDRHER